MGGGARCSCLSRASNPRVTSEAFSATLCTRGSSSRALNKYITSRFRALWLNIYDLHVLRCCTCYTNYCDAFIRSLAHVTHMLLLATPRHAARNTL